MKKIKVVYLVSTLGRTGPTRQLYNLVKYLNRDQFHATVVTLSPNPEANYQKEFSNLNINLQSLNLDRFSGILYGNRKVKSLLSTLRPDIIHSQGFRADWLCAKLNTYPVRITTQRNNPTDDYPTLYGSIVGLSAAHLHHRALLRIPIVVACSKSINNRQIPDGSQSLVIRNGVELENTAPLNSDNEKARARIALNLPEYCRLFVYAGPMISRKNPELLIRTFLSRDSKYDALCLLGSGPLLSTCRQLAGNNQNISLPGEVSNVMDYFRAADLFVSASRAEGMPNAVLEALSTGLPVILSDIPAHREILKACPEAGWLYTLGDQTDLCKHLDYTIITTKISRVARDLIKDNFSARSMSESYQQLYQNSLRSV